MNADASHDRRDARHERSRIIKRLVNNRSKALKQFGRSRTTPEFRRRQRQKFRRRYAAERTRRDCDCNQATSTATGPTPGPTQGVKL